MNPVYNPAPTGVPYVNPKGHLVGYPAGFPGGYSAGPAYTPNMYHPGANHPAFPTGYAPGTPFKMTCSPTTGAVPPYSSSPNLYPAAVFPVRSTYPQQNPYTQQGTYYTQPLYAAPPHVIHHTTVVQSNGMPAAMYAPPMHHQSRPHNGVATGMIAGTTMAMSAGTLLTHSPTPHQVTMPTYRHPGMPTYSYVPPSGKGMTLSEDRRYAFTLQLVMTLSGVSCQLFFLPFQSYCESEAQLQNNTRCVQNRTKGIFLLLTIPVLNDAVQESFTHSAAYLVSDG